MKHPHLTPIAQLELIPRIHRAITQEVPGADSRDIVVALRVLADLLEDAGAGYTHVTTYGFPP